MAANDASVVDGALHETGASGDETHPRVTQRFLTQEQIDEFMRNGVVVIPNVLTPEEVAAARAGLHGELAKYDVVRGWEEARERVAYTDLLADG